MAGKTIKIDFDFKKISASIEGYFKGLTNDMLAAWGVLGVGIILIIVGLFLL